MSTLLQNQIRFGINLNNLFRKMSSFVQILNPINGKSDWEVQDEKFDYIQEIARSAFADMLHDTERNRKYFDGLSAAIKKVKARGSVPYVLDIGTGTGILSMMAVSLGAEFVYACEAFDPMADCAKKIIKSNGMNDRIKVINKRSTSLKVGDGLDMPRRANILVTEVFDTELIGEGALKTFSHAHEHLLEKNCVVVPSSARMFAQVVESPFVLAWNKPKILPNLEGEILIRTPPAVEQCPGSQLLHDVQLSQLPVTSFKAITGPIKVFDFDWSGKIKLTNTRSSVTSIKSLTDAHAQAVFMWWDLQMDEDGEVLLSCAPYWAHPDFDELKKEAKREQNAIPWRDHWMQAIYFLPQQLQCRSGDEYRLIANHDEFSLWFDLVPPTAVDRQSEDSRCTCGFHMTYSRTRIGQLNSSLRNKKFMKVMEEQITKASVVLVLSEGSLLGLAMAAHGAKQVFVLEKNRLSRNALEMYKQHNKLDNVEIIEDLSAVPQDITHVFAEPHFNQSILPWDNFYFGTLLESCRQKLGANVEIFPNKGVIRAAAVHFLDLHKIQAIYKLKECHGFNMEIFDTLIEKATNLADSDVEAQPLWEYPCIALSQPVDLLSVDFREFLANKEEVAAIKIDESYGSLNGIAIWVEWHLTEDRNVVTTGATQAIEVGQFIQWDPYTRQGVHFMVNNEKSTSTINCRTVFNPSNGKLLFQFE